MRELAHQLELITLVCLITVSIFGLFFDFMEFGRWGEEAMDENRADQENRSMCMG